jgi:acetyl-CoA carboxylase carboxyl transferase subunit beta
MSMERTRQASATDTAVQAPPQTPGAKQPGGEPAARGPRPKRGVPEGLWQKCEGCGATIYRKEAEELLNVCPQCGFHWYVSAAKRMEQLLDAGTFEEWDADLKPADPLGFRDKKPYAERIVAEQKRTGLKDAALTGTGMIRARRVACGVTDSSFIMGSMGSVVGERLTRLVERATAGKLPLIIISASGGGARMHEGILSLMQMAKVSAGSSSRCSRTPRWAAWRRALRRSATSASRSRGP